MRIGDKDILNQKESGIKALDIDFVPKDFQVLIESQGYNVVYETAIKCPCKNRDSDHNLTCKNCGGGGWLFTNPTATKMIFTGIKLDKEIGETGRIDLGMLYATPVSLLKLSQMDRVTIIDGETAHSEVLYPTIDTTTGLYFAFTHYEVKSVDFLGLFEGDEVEVKRLIVNQDFVHSNNIIFLDEQYNTLINPQLTIRYIHSPQFHVWDIVNEIRSVKTTGGGSRLNNFMPMKAIVKRAHLFIDRENFDGDEIFDNSWITMDCKLSGEELTQLEQIVRNTTASKLYETLTALQKIQMKPLFQRVIDTPFNININFETPTVVIT